MESCFEEIMCRYIGQTVTVFTTSGGLSGNGFTGVLIGVDNFAVKLLVNMACAPECAVGSACTGWNPCGGGGGGWDAGYGSGWIGAEVIIPLRSIAGFVHNAI
jgi:hypothetical protein